MYNDVDMMHFYARMTQHTSSHARQTYELLPQKTRYFPEGYIFFHFHHCFTLFVLDFDKK